MTVCFLTISCQVNRKNQDIGIIESIPFSKDKYYKYDNGYLRPDPLKVDSLKSNVYTIVEPFEEKESLPKKIYDTNRFKKSIDYFEKELKGKNLSYIEIGNKIVIRGFYNEYKYASVDDKNRFTNLNELKKYLDNEKFSYSIIKYRKAGLTDIIDIDIDNKFYKIIINKNRCESFLFYNKKDTLNFYLYKNVLSNFYK